MFKLDLNKILKCFFFLAPLWIFAPSLMAMEKDGETKSCQHASTDALMKKFLKALFAISQETNKLPTAHGGCCYPEECRFEGFSRVGMRELRNGYANPAFFERVDVQSFRLKKDVSASEGLDAFFSGPTVAACDNMSVAWYYYALREVLGKNKFDELFGSSDKVVPERQRMLLSYNFFINPLRVFLPYLSVSSLEPGDRPCVMGVANYSDRHPEGVWKLEYAAVLGDGKVVGFGIEPCRLEDMCLKLVENYNKKSTSPTNITQEVPLTPASARGVDLKAVRRPNREAIATAAELSIPEAVEWLKLLLSMSPWK